MALLHLPCGFYGWVKGDKMSRGFLPADAETGRKSERHR